MSKLDLSIKFASPQRAYAPGDIVAGEVVVSANKDVDCTALVLDHRFATHGKGNKHKGEETKQTLFMGPWRAGETYRYAFEFPCPSGPPTYHGHYLNIDHYVRVRADIPWAIDPKTQAEFIVIPRPTTPEPQPPDEEDLVEQFHPRGAGSEWIGILFAGAVCGLIIYFVESMLFRSLCGGVFLVVAGGFLRKVMKRRVFEEVVLRARPERVLPGENVVVSISGAPRRTLSVERITATLRGQEICVSGSGTNETTHRHTLHEEQIELCRDARFFSEQVFEYETTFTMPLTDAFSFWVSDNEIKWTVEFQVHIPNWPDWKEELELQVVPTRPPDDDGPSEYDEPDEEEA